MLDPWLSYPALFPDSLHAIGSFPSTIFRRRSAMRQPPQTREEWIRAVWAPLLVPFLVNCCLWHFARDWMGQTPAKLVPNFIWFAAMFLIAFPPPWKLSLKKPGRLVTQPVGWGFTLATAGLVGLTSTVNGVSFSILREEYSLPLNALFQSLCLLLFACSFILCFKYSPQPEKVEFEL